MTRLGWLVVTLSLCAGCSGDGAGLGDSTCELAASTAGTVDWTSARSPACLIPVSSGAGILMVFVPVDEAVTRFEVDVEDVGEGETGVFPAAVTVAAGGGTFATPSCTVTITEHADTGQSDGFSREFRVEGEGTCTEPAVRAGDQATVDIAPFAFRFPAAWR